MGHDTVKDDAVNHIEKVEKGLASPSTSSEDTFDVKTAAKIRHRIDWRLIPALGAMYGMSDTNAYLHSKLHADHTPGISLMDRKNVSNAAIAGMLVDLRMGRGMKYNLVN